MPNDMSFDTGLPFLRDEGRKKGLGPEHESIFEEYKKQREEELENAAAELQKFKKKFSDLMSLVHFMMSEMDNETQKKFAEKLRKIIL